MHLKLLHAVVLEQSMYEQSMNHISLMREAVLNVIQSYTVQNANTRPHQLCCGDWEMSTAISHSK